MANNMANIDVFSLDGPPEGGHYVQILSTSS